MNYKTKTTIPAIRKYATIGVQTYGLRPLSMMFTTRQHHTYVTMLLRLALLLVLVMGGKGMSTPLV